MRMEGSRGERRKSTNVLLV